MDQEPNIRKSINYLFVDSLYGITQAIQGLQVKH